MPTVKKIAALLLALAVPALWVGAAEQPAPKAAASGGPRKAVCVIHGLGDHHGISGVVTFTQKGDEVEISGKITGLTPGKHGFHVHEFGDCSDPKGMSAGGHFNPDKMPHGGPHSAKRHVGDLGNIQADQSGLAVIRKTDKDIQLHGRHSIIGRSIIVHAKEDDLKDIASAGPRIACGVIGIAKAGK